MIVSFLSQKGGVGKTTLSLACAALWADSRRTLLIDADEQGSASGWASLREHSPFLVAQMARENMARDALALAADYAVTVIDGPPRAQRTARSVIVASDVVVIPIEPSGLSLWAATETIAQVRDAQLVKPTLKCGMVVSRKIGNTVLGRDVRDMAASEEIAIFETEVHQRVAFAEAVTLGQTIFEYAPGSAAAREVESLGREIEALHNG